MADTRRMSAGGALEVKPESDYISETRYVCPNCKDKKGARNNAHLYLKRTTDNSSTLECRFCDHTVLVPKGGESVIKK